MLGVVWAWANATHEKKNVKIKKKWLKFFRCVFLKVASTLYGLRDDFDTDLELDNQKSRKPKTWSSTCFYTKCLWTIFFCLIEAEFRVTEFNKPGANVLTDLSRFGESFQRCLAVFRKIVLQPLEAKAWKIYDNRIVTSEKNILSSKK